MADGLSVRKRCACAILLSLGVIFIYGLLWTHMGRFVPGPFQGMFIIMSGLWLIYMMSFTWKLFEPSMWTFRDAIRYAKGKL